MPINTENPIQIIRGDKASLSARTGKDGELNWATDTHELYIHDGKTRGGHLIGKTSGTGLSSSDFESPTMDSPGKSGLVPQPQATDLSVQPNNVLTMQGWKKISSTAMIPDEESGELIQGMDSLLDPVDLNDIYSGNYYLGNITANAPNDVTTGNLFAWRTEVGTTLQMFIAPSGIFVRGSTTDTGQFVWNPWTVIGAPRPKSAAGVGQWRTFNTDPGTGGQITVPSGGAWAYFLTGVNSINDVPDGTIAGVAAGGTVLTVVSGSGAPVSNVWGFCWRIV